MSKGEHTRPLVSDAHWRSPPGKGESIEIGPTDADMEGYFVIGVYGNFDCEFTVATTLEDGKIIHAHDSIPQLININKDSFHDIVYYHTSGPLQIRTVRDSGNYEIFINTLTDEDQGLIETMPTKDHHFWTKASKYTRDVFTISQSEQGFCEHCYYLMRIYAEDANLRATLVISSGTNFVRLSPDLTLRDHLPAGDKNLYSYYLSSSDIMDINMIVNVGNPRVYVSHSPTVNETNYIWIFNNEAISDYVVMSINNSQHRDEGLEVWDGKKTVTSTPSFFYFMITCDSDCDYSLTISRSNSTAVAYDGMVTPGFINPGEYNNYMYYANPDVSKTQRIKITVSVFKDSFGGVDYGDDAFKPQVLIYHFSKDKNSYNSQGAPITPSRVDETEPSNGQLAYRQQIQIPNI
mmetsp:Transcript_23308/g.20194  ORF Transcript_23308/g.20194 Transcript_23308/m.20194 type:complete len:406 (+) Transcript_23308:2123-3340(+)